MKQGSWLAAPGLILASVEGDAGSRWESGLGGGGVGWELGDAGSQWVPGSVPRELLFVVPSTCRGYSSLPVLRSVVGRLLRNLPG